MLRIALTSVLAVIICGAARAQTYSTGLSARSIGLGGGIALPGSEVSSSLNPAALADADGIRVLMPQITLSREGELSDEILANIIENGDFEHLTDLGVDLTNERNVLWTAAEESLRVGQFEIGVGGGGQLVGSPNRPLRRWARQGHFGIPPRNARLRTEFGYFGTVPVSYGHRFQVTRVISGNLDLGIRFSALSGVYQRDSFRVNRRGKIIRTPQADTRDTDFDLTLGARFTPARARTVSYAAVLRGLRAQGIGRLQQSRSLDLGTAWKVNSRLQMVADWTDLANLGGTQRFSVGGEYQVRGIPLTLRAAVTTRGLTIGGQVGILSLAYTDDGRSMLRTGVAF